MEEKLAKYFSGEATLEEKQEISDWRSASEENAKEFFSYKSTWAETISIQPSRTAASITGDVEDDTAEDATKTRHITSNTGWLRYAAVIALLVVGGLFVFSNWENWTTEPTGLTSELKLDDGTRVTLYKDAKLSEVSMTEDRRVVKVTGKAYFDVERDENRPFVIYTNEAKVEVLGTSFVVDAKNDYTTEVIVESGLVSFSANPEYNNMLKTSVQLTKGEKGIITPQAKGIIKQNNRDKNYLAWQNQLLIFNQSKLTEVAQTIEQVYGYTMKFDNQAIEKCSLSAKYSKKTPEEIAELIGQTFGFQVKVTTDKQIIIDGESCFN